MGQIWWEGFGENFGSHSLPSPLPVNGAVSCWCRDASQATSVPKKLFLALCLQCFWKKLPLGEEERNCSGQEGSSWVLPCRWKLDPFLTLPVCVVLHIIPFLQYLHLILMPLLHQQHEAVSSRGQLPAVQTLSSLHACLFFFALSLQNSSHKSLSSGL